jgi:hypothetical protein
MLRARANRRSTTTGFKLILIHPLKIFSSHTGRSRRSAVCSSTSGPVHRQGRTVSGNLVYFFFTLCFDSLCLLQILLDAALSPLPISHSRVSFSLVGCQEDGFTSSVIEVRTNALGIQANSALSAVRHLLPGGRVHQMKTLTIALRAGEVCTFLHCFTF